MPEPTPSEKKRPAADVVPARPRRAAFAALEPPALTHPAMLFALLVVTACAVIGSTFVMTDTDMWQHLAVGRAIWTEHRIPMTNEWTWPTYGEKQLLPSWLFRALLWPFHMVGGMAGVQAWRWVTTIAVFLFAWLTARRLGARGFAALAMIAWCVLVYRHRVYVRPETLSAVLVAATLWILATRRAGGPDRAWWLVALAWIWPNAHISYWMYFALVGIHAFSELFDGPARAGAPVRKTSLWLVLAASVAAAFANPFGWKTLEEPFLYFTVWKNEPIFKTIGELLPVDWKFLQTTGYLALFLLWPLLTTIRARKRGWDIAELLTWALFSVLGLQNQRFVSVWAVVAAPYLARGAASLAADIRWPGALRPAWTRAALFALVVIGGSLTDWRRKDLPFGTGVLLNSYPAGAADFMAAHDIRGRGFNHFEMGGYLLWRFWPDRERLPFFDIHLTGKPEDRTLAGLMLSHEDAWRRLDTKYRFPYVLLRRLHGATDVSLDILEADTTFALVFYDDAATVFLRREGPYAALADSLAYRVVRAGRAGMAQMGMALTADSTLRPVLRREFEQMIASSKANSSAHSMLAQMDLVEGRLASAREHLIAAHEVDPDVPLFHERVGAILLREGNAAAAARELEISTRTEKSPTAWSWLGVARAQLGNRDGAIQAFRRALELDPGDARARMGLDSLGSF